MPNTVDLITRGEDFLGNILKLKRAARILWKKMKEWGEAELKKRRVCFCAEADISAGPSPSRLTIELGRGIRGGGRLKNIFLEVLLKKRKRDFRAR